MKAPLGTFEAGAVAQPQGNGVRFERLARASSVLSRFDLA